MCSLFKSKATKRKEEALKRSRTRKASKNNKAQSKLIYDWSELNSDVSAK